MRRFRISLLFFRPVCQEHVRQSGAVHVHLTQTLPVDQAFYDRLSRSGWASKIFPAERRN